MEPNVRSGARTLAVIAVSAIGLLGALVLFFWVLFRLNGNYIGSEVTLPLLAIVGVLTLLFALALISVAFAAVQLSDRTQALGLPEGSVQAVIALSLVVLFAILAIFLYGGLSNGQLNTLTGLTDVEKAHILTAGTYQVIRTELVTPSPAPTPSPPASPQPTIKPTPSWTVVYREPPNQPSSDFAKQLLVLIGTLVTSVASFYFGAQTAIKAQAGSASTTPGAPPTGTAPIEPPPTGTKPTGTIPPEPPSNESPPADSERLVANAQAPVDKTDEARRPMSA